VGECDYPYKPIPIGIRYAILRILYRPIELLYWILLTFRTIREFDPDVLLATYAYSAGFVGCVAALLAKKACVVHAVGSDLREEVRTLLGRCIISWTVRNASGVVCVSKDLQNRAKQLGAKDTVVIPDPIDTPECEYNEFKRKRNMIISVSNLNPAKGISYLIRAIRRMKDVMLIVIGEGTERRKLEALSHELGLDKRVFFLGWIDHGPRFWNYLLEATVFVLPSTSEGTPRALIEAMACGLPVIATKVGGIPEVVTDGVNGFLVPSRNEEQLATAIKRVLKDDNFRKNVSATNRNAAKRYSMELIGQELFNYLRKVSY
jgi:glycosyltransferase involved in cell wall biosynthesis